MNFVTITVPDLGLVNNPTPYVSLDWLLDNSGDLVINPDGTYAMATGSIKLQQDIKLFLLSPPGTSLQDSQWGNPAVLLIGTAPQNPNQITSIIQGALVTLKHYKDNEAKTRGYPLEGSELISSIIETNILQSQSNSNNFTVNIVCSDGTGTLNDFNVQLGAIL